RADKVNIVIGRHGLSVQMCLTMTLLRYSFCATPTTDSTTWPSLNSRRVGIPFTWYLNATLGFSSTFSFPIVTLPLYSPASASIIGAMRLQGPHHSAQKSTSTGPPDLSTVSSKFPSVNVCTLSVAVC